MKVGVDDVWMFPIASFSTATTPSVFRRAFTCCGLSVAAKPLRLYR